MDLNLITDCYRSMNHVTPLVRTDFTDDDTWDAIVEAVTRPAFFDKRDDMTPVPKDPDNEAYVPSIKPISDLSFDGATLSGIIDAWVPPKRVGYMLLTDERTFRDAATGAEITVLYVDLRDNEHARDHPDWYPDWSFGMSFRCTTRAIALIECNLGIANVSFSELHNQQGPDGVVRSQPR